MELTVVHDSSGDAGGSAVSANGWPSRDPVTDDVAAALLLAGDIEVVGQMPWSSNATYLVDLVDDRHRILAIYKPRRGERPLWDFPTGTLSQREAAAFELSEALGWRLVPETVMREGPVGEGSVQRFYDHDPEDHYFQILEEGGNEQVLRRFAVFDVLANNTDRKAGHLLRGADAHVWGIDHGLCFHPEWKLRTVIWDFGGEQLDDELCAGVRAVADDFSGTLGSRLAPLLSSLEIEAIARRAEHLLTTGRLPAVDPGYHSYPWPLV